MFSPNKDLDPVEASNQPWFVLYDGTSTDGRGQPKYSGRTLDVNQALKHLEKCAANPYSIGKVKVFTEKNAFQASLEGLRRMKAAIEGTPSTQAVVPPATPPKPAVKSQQPSEPESTNGKRATNNKPKRQRTSPGRSI